MNFIKIFRENPNELISALLLLIFFFPLIITPNNSLFLIHDNMDGIVPLFTFLGNSPHYWASGNTIVDGIIGGEMRATFPAALSFISLCFYFFPPLVAFSIHYVFQHLLAYISMRLFLKEVLNVNRLITNGVALVFAFLPFYPGASLTVAGLPLLSWALVFIFKKQHNYKHWLIVFLFPFFSSIPFGNMFTFPILFLISILGVYSQYWRFSIRFFLAFVLLGVSSLIAEYQLFDLILSGFDSNRSHFVGSAAPLNFKGIIGVTGLAFLFGHYHFQTLHVLIVLLVFSVGLWMFYKKRYKECFYFFIIPTLILFLCFVTIYVPNKLGNQGFRVNIRFWALFPFLWYAMFAVALNKIKYSLVTKIALAVQIVWVMFLLNPKDYYGSTYSENVFANAYFKNEENECETFNEYFKVIDFEQLSKQYPYIKEKQVVCIGFVPGIALFNGYNTFDAYLNIFSKEKADVWKRINQEEHKIGNIKKAFSNKAYLYSSELENSGQISKEPQWDRIQLKKSKVEFILSTLPNLPGYEKLAVVGSIHVYKI